jgi:hypothetical protein
MSGSSNTEDGSDILWPGYVDAVTNLAINLLFVIAIMSIVVLGATLQIAELSKRRATEGDVITHTTAVGAETKTLAQLEARLTNTTEQLRAAEEKLRLAQEKIALSVTPTNAQQAKTIDVAAQSAPAPRAGGVHEIDANALVVKFATESVVMGEGEIQQLLGKVEPLKVNHRRWNITVISPRGFSEASRTAYYRAHAVRNALLQGGIASTAIDLRILESTQSGADNTQVLVKPLP